MHIQKSKPGRIETVLCSLLLTFLALGTSPAAADAYQPPANNRVDYNLNVDWKFLKQDDAGAAQAAYDDSAWTPVSLPHTWNDIDTFSTWTNAKKSWDGVCWYRKHFTLDAAYTGRKVIIEFECISLEAKFYVNGQAAGSYSSGISPCGVDITDFVKFGGDNVLSVQVSNKGGNNLPGQPFNPNFGGINRDVILHIADKVYQTYPLWLGLNTMGTYIYSTDFDSAAKTSTLNVEEEVKNDDKADKSVTPGAVVVDRDGNKVLEFSGPAQTVGAGKVAVLKIKSPMTNVHFWSPDYPYLYKVYSTLAVDGKPVDVLATNIGVRQYTFSATGGLQVNGHPVYLKGYAPRTPMEWAVLGGAPIDWLTDFDFKLIKEDNGNFLRPMHMAPRRHQVEAADKFGVIMVVPGFCGENDGGAWEPRISALHDATIYYRNNASVAFYEGCNGQLSAAHAAEALKLRKTIDPYGGRMAGMRSNDANVTISMREYSGTMDSAGTNATTPVWDAEYARGECPRRVWDSYTPELNPRWDGKDPATKYVLGGYFAIASDYHRKLGFNVGGEGVGGDSIRDYIKDGQLDHGYFRLNTSEDMVLENLAKYYARYARSAFVQSPDISTAKGIISGGAKIIWADSWTDGRMKDTDVSRVSGVIDAVRLPKEVYYGMQVAQNDKPQVYIVGHWNYPAGTTKRVYVVSNTAKVKLEVLDPSGKLIKDYGFGKNDFVKDKGDQMNHYCYAFEDVAWQAGSIKATGYDDKDTVVATNEKATAGAPAALKMTPIIGPSGKFQADGSDIAMIDVEVVDAKGNRCPTYEDRVDFTCSGDSGVFLGGYNSGIQHSFPEVRDNSPYHFNIECGINRVFVRSNLKPGTFTLNVTGTGLTAAKVTLTSVAVPLTNGLLTDPPQTYTVPLGSEPAPVKAEGAPVGAMGDSTAEYSPQDRIKNDMLTYDEN